MTKQAELTNEEYCRMNSAYRDARLASPEHEKVAAEMRDQVLNQTRTLRSFMRFANKLVRLAGE